MLLILLNTKSRKLARGTRKIENGRCRERSGKIARSFLSAVDEGNRKERFDKPISTYGSERHWLALTLKDNEVNTYVQQSSAVITKIIANCNVTT